VTTPAGCPSRSAPERDGALAWVCHMFRHRGDVHFDARFGFWLGVAAEALR